MSLGRTVSLALSVLIAGSGANAGQADAQERPAATFRSAASAVAVDVSVRRGARPVTGLTADAFEITDDGEAQDVSSLTYEKLPIDITVALDVSASVTGPVLERMRRAVRELKADLGPADRLRLLAFDARVRRALDFGSDAPLDAVLKFEGEGGGSAIFDTLAVSLTDAADAARRHLIVLFSDGIDSGSITGFETLIDVAKRTTPTVTVVLPTESALKEKKLDDDAPDVRVGSLYQRLAAETGGSVLTVGESESLGRTFRKALDTFRSSYVLYFTPRGADRPGVHALSVRVKQRDVDVRARTSYVAK